MQSQKHFEEHFFLNCIVHSHSAAVHAFLQLLFAHSVQALSNNQLSCAQWLG